MIRGYDFTLSIAEQEEATTLRMQMAWAALYPNSDYGHWAQAFQYAEERMRRNEAGELLPESFDRFRATRPTFGAIEDLCQRIKLHPQAKAILE